MERVGLAQIGDYGSPLGGMIILGGNGVGRVRGLVCDESSFYGAWFCRGLVQPAALKALRVL
jgi:hypothetical protein